MSTFISQESSLTHASLEQMLIATNGPVTGVDSDGNDYDSILALWDTQLTQTSKDVSSLESGQDHPVSSSMDVLWYNKAFQYWESAENCPITDDGVLGGYGRVTPMDTRDSHAFIDRLLALHEHGENSEEHPKLKLGRAADCGAGIGRVTKNVLLPRFERVDLVEQSPRLLAAAPRYMLSTNNNNSGTVNIAANTVVDNPRDEELATLLRERITLINLGLQDFAPEPGTYDVIWIQWVIGHLHDLDCINFFRRCSRGLRPGGVIVLKDNLLLDTPSEKAATFIWDRDDSSVARHLRYMQLLLTLAGLQIVLQVQQTGFPEELLPVLMLAIAPVPNPPSALPPGATSS